MEGPPEGDSRPVTTESTSASDDPVEKFEQDFAWEGEKLDGELVLEAEWFCDALRRNDVQLADCARRLAQQDRVLCRLEDALQQPAASQQGRARKSFASPTLEGSLAVAAERHAFHTHVEDSPGVAALLTEFTDAARRQCDDAPTEQLWEEVDEVLAHGRVEMLSAEPWASMPEELFDVHFQELRSMLYSQVMLTTSPDQEEKEARFNAKVRRHHHHADSRVEFPGLDDEVAHALSAELAEAPRAADPREKLQVLVDVLEMVSTLVSRGRIECTADTLIAAVVALFCRAPPPEELYRTVGFLRSYLERHMSDRMGPGGYAVTTFEAAILALMVREEPVKARFASPSVHSQRINPSLSWSAGWGATSSPPAVHVSPMGSPPAMHAGLLSPGMVPPRPQLGRTNSPLAPSMPGAPQLATMGRAQSMGAMGPQYVVVGQALLSPGPCVHFSVPFPAMGANSGKVESHGRAQRLPEKHREAPCPTMSPEKPVQHHSRVSAARQRGTKQSLEKSYAADATAPPRLDKENEQGVASFVSSVLEALALAR